MKKYFVVLCYNNNGQPSFLRTPVFEAEDEDKGYPIGERILDEKYPDEVKEGYNCWLVSADEIIQECENPFKSWN